VGHGVVLPNVETGADGLGVGMAGGGLTQPHHGYCTKSPPWLAHPFGGERFPVDRLVRNYPFAQLNQAIADSLSGATIKPVLTFE